MIDMVVDVVLMIGEMFFAIRESPIFRPRREIEVGDIFFAKRQLVVTAVIRPLTAESTRFQISIPAGMKMRVDLALPVPGHEPCFSCIDPIDPASIPHEHRGHALLAGIWLEIPPRILRSNFARPGPVIRLKRAFRSGSGSGT